MVRKSGQASAILGTVPIWILEWVWLVGSARLGESLRSTKVEVSGCQTCGGVSRIKNGVQARERSRFRAGRTGEAVI